MKFGLIVALLMCQMTYAQSMKEIRIKKEMIDRVELIIEKVDTAQEDLEKEDVVAACKGIKEIFQIFPDHLKAIGTHMDFERVKTIKAKDLALNELIFFHRQTLECDSGKNSENVDPKKLRKELKVIERKLKKQRRIIKKSDTDLENSFYYHYEF
jgi:hypothetical protein